MANGNTLTVDPSDVTPVASLVTAAPSEVQPFEPAAPLRPEVQRAVTSVPRPAAPSMQELDLATGQPYAQPDRQPLAPIQVGQRLRFPTPAERQEETKPGPERFVAGLGGYPKI